ncbi:MAG: sodium-translocating pyrophosphatase [Candidatus Pacearchaeota archaeon]
MLILLFIFLVILISLIFVIFLIARIIKFSTGKKEIQDISNFIKKGAITFLNQQYLILIPFIIIIAILLSILDYKLAITFIFGAIFSIIAGNIGMRIATSANGRAANACNKNISEGFKIAFYGGSVMGFFVVSLGLFGIAIFYLIFKDPNILYGFGFGASSIALFARVGGGIYTKAADVGADLVGKVEAGIPEDDPRNPAVIADNVGDNVGDIAGMGADLFESYVDSIIAAMVLGTFININAVIFPLLLASAGIIASLIGFFFVRGDNVSKAMNKGIFVSAFIFLILSFILSSLYLNTKIFYAIISGLVAGLLIGLLTEFYTSYKFWPTRKIAKASTTGAGTNLITGISVAMQSILWPIIFISLAIIISFFTNGLYGIAISAVGMLATLAITLASDCYGPIADNAAGIAEMAKLGKQARTRAEFLDAIGNTTAAIGKGFAIGSAALTALALFVSFSNIANLKAIDINNPLVVVGLFIGCLMPFLFSSFTLNAVSNAAFKVVEEVRKQWKDKDIRLGKKKPDYNRCISITTRAALKNMIIPSLLALIVPIIIGFILGFESLAGLLAGSVASSFVLAIFMANSGGAWDNAKKYIEAGNYGGKNSDAHKAAVIGDTVGDPLKDTSGPSLNILIKLMSIVSIIFAILAK